MQLTKSSLHQGKLVVKPPLEDQDVWGNKFVARQWKVVMERFCLVTVHERKVLVHDFCTPSSLPSLVSDVSDDEEWGEADPAFQQQGEGLGRGRGTIGGGQMLCQLSHFEYF